MANILQRLDARDRALFARWVLQPTIRAGAKRFWVAVTHLGSAWCTISLALAPLFGVMPFAEAGSLPLIALLASHAVIQAIKRTTARRRPSEHDFAALVGEPDRFSFPSGHATAAMAIGVGYATAFPELAPLIVCVAALVGMSRVLLGVHYPGDVFVGQLIAILSAACLAISL
jgi:undecaprenyl-diphosphatase